MKKLTIEQKIARFLAWEMRGKDYSEMAEWMGKDRDAFNAWVSENAHSMESNPK